MMQIIHLDITLSSDGEKERGGKEGAEGDIDAEETAPCSHGFDVSRR